MSLEQTNRDLIDRLVGAPELSVRDKMKLMRSRMEIASGVEAAFEAHRDASAQALAQRANGKPAESYDEIEAELKRALKVVYTKNTLLLAVTKVLDEEIDKGPDGTWENLAENLKAIEGKRG